MDRNSDGVNLPEIYIIDASSLLFRAYYAIPKMSSPEGLSTNALFGFIRSIMKWQQEKQPSYAVVVFDSKENKKSRQELFADYKSHRQAAPEDLPYQIEFAKEYCRLAGLPTLCVDGVEADDTIASVTHFWTSQKGRAIVFSADKDLCQLVSPRCLIYNPHKSEELIDREAVFKLFEVWPEQIADYLALIGDDSDNIPGVAGCGPKKGALLLKTYGSLQGVLEALPSMKDSALTRSLKETALHLPLYQHLATTDPYIKVPDLPSFYSITPPDSHIASFFEKMGFRSLANSAAAPKPPASIEKKCVILSDEKSLLAFLDQIPSHAPVCIDTETSSLDIFSATLVGIGIGTSKDHIAYIPLNSPQGAQLKALFASFMQEKQPALIGHNLKFDLHILTTHGIPWEKLHFDTLIASLLLNSDENRHNLDHLAKVHFDFDKIPIESLIGKGKKTISMEMVDISLAANYCTEDVEVTWRLFELFEKELQSKGMSSLFKTIEMPLIPILFAMERRGIYLDAAQLEKEGKEIHHEIEEIEKKILTFSKNQININSPKQLSHLLFEELAIPYPKPTKKETLSTGIDILEQLEEKHPVIPLIMRYRLLEKLSSTYIDKLIAQISPVTGRVHTSFRQLGAATGRLASQEPNLQNIPVRSVEGQKIRSAFTPKEKDWVFVSADYSQIELRILAHLSDDKTLCDAFLHGNDVHAKTASMIFEVDEKNVTDSMRNRAKAVNFGIIYGQQAFGLSQILKIPVNQASLMIENYFTCHPGVKKFIDFMKNKAHEKGYTETPFGRKRFLSDIHSRNLNLKNGAERLAINSPIQGLQSDLIKLAMIKIGSMPLPGYLLLQIHDELIFECPEKEASTLSEMVKKTMEEVYPLKVPLKVNVTVGKNWGEC